MTNKPKSKTKCVFSPQLAQFLVQSGFIIVDLKANYNKPGQTVFVFQKGPGFDEQWAIWLDDKGD